LATSSQIFVSISDVVHKGSSRVFELQMEK